jgi:hypothetical protein
VATMCVSEIVCSDFALRRFLIPRCIISITKEIFCLLLVLCSLTRTRVHQVGPQNAMIFPYASKIKCDCDLKKEMKAKTDATFIRHRRMQTKICLSIVFGKEVYRST